MDNLYFESENTADMQALDKLPPSVRAALSGAQNCMSAQLALTYIERGYSEAQVIASIEHHDAALVRSRSLHRGAC